MQLFDERDSNVDFSVFFSLLVSGLYHTSSKLTQLAYILISITCTYLHKKHTYYELIKDNSVQFAKKNVRIFKLLKVTISPKIYN